MKTAIAIIVIALVSLGRPCSAYQIPVAQEELILAKQLSAAQQDVQLITRKMEDVQQRIRNETGLVETLPPTLPAMINKLQEDRQQLELAEAGEQGRQKALETAIAKLSKQVYERVRRDAAAQQLEDIVAIREKQLDRLKRLLPTKAVGNEQVEDAEIKLASAGADVAAARQKAVSSASAEALDAWNRQLLELSISAAEREGRLDYIKHRIGQLLNGLPYLDELASLADQLAHARLNIQNLQTNLDNLRMTQPFLEQRPGADAPSTRPSAK